MNIEDKIYDLLKSLANGNIFPAITKQNESVPYITYQVITTEYDHTLRGETVLATPVYQFDCVCSTRNDALSLAKSVRDILDNYKDDDIEEITVINMTEMPNYTGTENIDRYAFIVEAEITYKEN